MTAIAASTISPEEAAEQFGPLVRIIAYKTLRRLPQCVQIDDLIQAGMVGLLEAARNYSNKNGASFSTFAAIRIQGAILDELRRDDLLTRTKRRNARKITAAKKRLERDLGCKPLDTEIADAIGVQVNTYRRMAFEITFGSEVSFDELEGASVFLDDDSDPALKVEQADFSSWLVVQRLLLSARQRRFVALYYDDGLTLREIAQQVGISQARVSQILQQAVAQIRANLFAVAAA